MARGDLLQPKLTASLSPALRLRLQSYASAWNTDLGLLPAVHLPLRPRRRPHVLGGSISTDE